jgi:hypothetical protein
MVCLLSKRTFGEDNRNVLDQFPENGSRDVNVRKPEAERVSGTEACLVMTKACSGA